MIATKGYQENSPLENSHPENSHRSNSLLENSTQENSLPSRSPWKIPPRKIPTHQIPPWRISLRNIPTHIFKQFVFSLLLPLSLTMVKGLYFCLLKMLKLDLMRFAACLQLRKCFGYDRNVFHIFIREMFNFSIIRPHEKEISKEPKKTCEESFCMLKTTFL